MKQITNVAIGGRNFIISNEAYAILDSWLERFRSKIEPASQADDVMVEIEERIAELFTEAASGPNYVVDTDLAGVCSGIARYFDIDVLLVRVIAVVLIFCGTSGFWAYIILWFLSPLAETPLQKCELRGIAPTAENLRRFRTSK